MSPLNRIDISLLVYGFYSSEVPAKVGGFSRVESPDFQPVFFRCD